MLPVFIVFSQRINNGLQVFFITYKISIARINKNCFYIMLFDIMGICFLYAEEILIRNILFKSSFSFFNVLLQFIHWRVEVNDNVGLHDLLVNNFKQALVQTEFIFVQIYFCK